MDTKKLKKHEIIASLRKMNRKLLIENKQLSRQIMVLEGLAISTKIGYNCNTIEEEQEQHAKSK
jgi:hypothetical protein